jgi:deoxyribodipyrimidine photo-lyase
VPRLAKSFGASCVFCSHDDDPYALERDRRVAARLKAEGAGFESVKDHVVFERQEVVSQAGTPFTVFTPYGKAWLARLRPEDVAEARPDDARFALASSLEAAGLRCGNLALEEIGFVPSPTWLEPGAAAGRKRLRDFLPKLGDYPRARDMFGGEGTSGISAHLRFGTVSVRECVRAVWPDNGPGAAKWRAELVWREFYHAILANFPHVVGDAFREEYRGLDWPGTAEHFEAWRQGQTGYPVVDAAMRCLRATGWMHNRLRMVAAMFLTKDLLVDWRLGEAEFARWLLDFDLANNNGGWQWSASTGVDAQPYFRIFNPVLQSRKFDPGGGFIRRWCPEIAHLDDERIHWPHDAGQPSLGLDGGYPAPVVDHSLQRRRAIEFLSRGLSSPPG